MKNIDTAVKQILEKVEKIVDEAYWDGESAGGVDYGTENYSPSAYVEDIESDVRSTLTQAIEEAVKEGKAYIGKTKREWYMKGYEEAKKEEREKKITENTSDGYHTFKELYEFRKVYNAVLFNEWAKQGKFNVHKSKRHHDGELCFGGGWFIVLATLPTGQISNHYELKDWDLFQCQEREKADEWDGHTPQDVVKRLLSLSQQTPQEKEEPDYNKAMYDLEHKEECACDTRINQFCKIHGYHRDRKGSS